MIHKLLGQSVSTRKRIAVQKTSDSCHVSDTRDGVSTLPIDDAHLIAPDYFCHVDLTKLQVEPALPDHFTDRLRNGGIPGHLLKVRPMGATHPL